jgi:hypothetical protein
MSDDRGRVWREWSPLLGETYTRELLRVRKGQYAWFAVGVMLTLLMVGLIAVLSNSVFLWPVAGLFVLLAVGSYLAGSLPLLRLGQRIARDLEQTGHTLTHMPSIQNSFTFSKWLSANHLDAVALEAAARSRPDGAGANA